MKLVIETNEDSEGMYELLDSFKECLSKNAPATLSPVHIKKMRILK